MSKNPNHLAITRKMLFFIVVVIFSIFYFDFFAHNQTEECKAAERSFKGKSYGVKLCFLHRSDVGIDYLSLRVYDGGYLVAERKLKRYTDSGERVLNGLEYKDDEIAYTDADPERNDPPSEKHLSMPPTRWDWFTANYWPF